MATPIKKILDLTRKQKTPEEIVKDYIQKTPHPSLIGNACEFENEFRVDYKLENGEKNSYEFMFKGGMYEVFFFDKLIATKTVEPQESGYIDKYDPAPKLNREKMNEYKEEVMAHFDKHKVALTAIKSAGINFEKLTSEELDKLIDTAEKEIEVKENVKIEEVEHFPMEAILEYTWGTLISLEKVIDRLKELEKKIDTNEKLDPFALEKIDKDLSKGENSFLHKRFESLECSTEAALKVYVELYGYRGATDITSALTFPEKEHLTENLDRTIKQHSSLIEFLANNLEGHQDQLKYFGDIAQKIENKSISENRRELERYISDLQKLVEKGVDICLCADNKLSSEEMKTILENIDNKRSRIANRALDSKYPVGAYINKFLEDKEGAQKLLNFIEQDNKTIKSEEETLDEILGNFDEETKEDRMDKEEITKDMPSNLEL